VERNVLPLLNNLLENREMQLDDGRFLVAPSRFDRLLMVSAVLGLFSVLYDKIQEGCKMVVYVCVCAICERIVQF